MSKKANKIKNIFKKKATLIIDFYLENEIK